MKEKVKYCFVILVFRNTSDLVECLESINKKVHSYKAIVVNAFYDDNSKVECERIAQRHGCLFLNIENKGYSYGNNRGIELANEKYDYQYVIVSNPDIVIDKFNDELLTDKFEYDVIAPKIVAASGRRQNPMVVRNIPIINRMEYLGFKHRNLVLVNTGIIISKFCRWYYITVSSILREKVFPIFEAHGSFVLLSNKVVRALHPVYDEKMFLFAEEGVLAAKTQKAGFKTCYFDYIQIRHKEDGSMKLSNFSLNDELCKANIYCYETYYK